MRRAFYRFGHDLALRLGNGQAFALSNAELGASIGDVAEPLCFLRGTFSGGSFRGLIIRGLIKPHPELQAQGLPVNVQLNLRPELAAKVAKDAANFEQIGRRLDQNSMRDELARSLLMFEVWQCVSAVSAGQKVRLPIEVVDAKLYEPDQEAALAELMSDIGSELWVAATSATLESQPPLPEIPVTIGDAIRRFFEDEEWEATAESENLYRSTFDGQNGTWMCYTKILPDVEQVVFYSVCPVNVPAASLPSMTESLNKINAELTVGNFELDFGFHVVRFRTSIDVTGVGLSPLLFRNVVLQNLTVMEYYLPALFSIISGNLSFISSL